jgi:hypothetical protein
MIYYKDHKPTGMPTQKVFRLFFIISFSLVFLVGSYLALSCLCGGCLPPSFQDLNSSFKLSASKGSFSNNQQICYFINGKAVKSSSLNKHLSSEKIFQTLVVSDPCAYLFDRFQINSAQLQKISTHPITELYLKNLSFRC